MNTDNRPKIQSAATKKATISKQKVPKSKEVINVEEVKSTKPVVPKTMYSIKEAYEILSTIDVITAEEELPLCLSEFPKPIDFKKNLSLA